MSRKIPVPPKQELADRYNERGQTISTLAKLYNTSNPTIRKWLISYDIERKDHLSACKEAAARKEKDIPPLTEIVRAYNEFSFFGFQKHFGIGQETAYKWLDHYGIRQTFSERCSIGKSRQFEDIRFSKEEIQDAYDKNLIYQDAADYLGISVSHFRQLKDRYEIKTNTAWKSKEEINLFEYCKSLDESFISGDKSTINPFELDIVHHGKKLAIEYCGVFWHSEVSGNKDKAYHKHKMELCRKKGYDLITVFSSDPMDKIHALIRSKLGLNKRIYARNTTAVKLSSEDANLFHTKHHIHGSVNGSKNFGLMFDGELVMVLSFGKSRFNKKYEWECTRMTSHSEYSVVGGASKLFAYSNISNCITYSDLRFGHGDVYTNCGFTFDGYSSPNYYYTNNYSMLMSRNRFQKHKLKDVLKQFDSTKTEFENMVMNGYDRIWDCGNSRWIINR